MMNLRWRIKSLFTVLSAVTVLGGWHQSLNAASPQAVTTYHYDTLRTGWNSNETALTPSNVNSTTFGMLHSVALDEQVDAQPLIVPNEKITAGSHQGIHEVVYVATENNTIYAIDAVSGQVLLRRNLGAAVKRPLNCGNNSRVVGINSTPVIDVVANVMYVISYIAVPSGNTTIPTYRIHELDLGDLTDAVPPVTVSASHLLTDGAVYHFNATVQRQRPGLLEANGNIYAAFGSFCDFKTNLTRGWVLGWRKGTLSPLPGNKLTDTQTPPKSSYYLSSVWMSGYGIASDSTGDVYFVTGNSDRTNNVWDGVTDIQESVVRLSHSDLNAIVGIFAPTDEFTLDQHDRDYGSGGVLLLPPQPGSTPPLAAAVGKEGNLFLLDRNAMTGFGKGIVDEVGVGACWCGQSYFDDGVGRIVTSGGSTVRLWTIQTSPSIKLVQVASQGIVSGQDPGFFTTISSSGANNGIIWAVSRPKTTTTITLYALNAKPSGTTLPILFQAAAGSWANTGGNANIVPVVANGHVFVASNQQLSIFGLKGPSDVTVTPIPQPIAQSDGSQHEIFGTIISINGSQLTLQTRNGSLVQVDTSAAVEKDQCVNLEVGEAVDIRGTFDANGGLLASSIGYAKDSPELWPADI